MATKLQVVCPDAIVYLERAQALERGDFEFGLEHLRLNTLPLILVALHRAGLDWELAGKLWGITVSTAVILPLFGWTRRQFDDRIATLACVLYAIHPGMIERSPDIIREPTFWLLGQLSLYASWRAAAEVRLRWLLLAGVGILLAVFTRLEGALLLLPLVGWCAARYVGADRRQRRLLLGLAIALFALPMTLFLIAHALLPDARLANLLRLEPLYRAELWARSWISDAETINAVSPPQYRSADYQAELKLPALLKKYTSDMVRGLDPLILILMPTSFVGWAYVWRRRDQWPLLLAAGGILWGAWIHLWYAHEMSSRYALSVFLLLCPLCALGLCWPKEVRARLLPNALAHNSAAQASASLTLLLAFTIVGWSDALASSFQSREAQAMLGRSIAERFGREPIVAGTPRISGLVAYYAGSRLRYLSPADPIDRLVQIMEDARPDAILLDRKQAELCRRASQRCAAWGMTPAPTGFFPPHYKDDALLLLRDASAIARTEASTHR